MPYADERVLGPAQQLALSERADRLAKLAQGPKRFATLGAALIRCDLADDYDAVRQAARG